MAQTRTTLADPQESTTSPSGWLADAKQQIEELEDYAPGWDEPNPLPLDAESRLKAQVVVSKLAELEPVLRAPRVTSTVHGGVEVEWHNGTQCVSFSVDAEEGIDFFCKDRTRGVVCEGPEPDKALLHEILANFRP